MQNYTIIEIAIMGIGAMPLPTPLIEYGIRQPAHVDHYWRVRWMEGGEEADQCCEFNDLAGMARQARDAGEPVVWRYYETGV